MFFKQASFHVVTHRVVVVTKQAFQMCKCCPIANICLQRIVFLDVLSKSYVKNFASKCKDSRLRLDNLTRPTILTLRLCPTEHSVLRNTKTYFFKPSFQTCYTICYRNKHTYNLGKIHFVVQLHFKKYSYYVLKIHFYASFAYFFIIL